MVDDERTVLREALQAIEAEERERRQRELRLRDDALHRWRSRDEPPRMR